MPLIAPAPICSYLDDDFPVPRRLRPLAVALVELEYTDLGVQLIIAHANRHGSLWCAGSLVDPEHIERLEETLPDDPDWAQDHDAWRWDLGPEAAGAMPDAALASAARSWEAPS